MYKIVKILFFISVLFSFQNLIAQTQPSGILFQAVARDASNNAAANRTIYAIVEIREVTSTGSTVYSESHQVLSNDEGIFNLIIGNGARLSGATKFDNLNWRSQIYFINLKVAIAPSLPTPGWDLSKEYVDMGTSQIWAVPYAFSAFKAVIADSATKFGGVLSGESGGTGINNTGKTITLGRSFEIQGLGNLKFNTTGITSLTLPQKGLLVSTDGIDTLSNKYILSPILLGKPLTPTADSLSSDSTIANIKYVKASISNQIAVLKDQVSGIIDSSSGLRLKISDTSAMLTNRIKRDTSFLLQKKDTITLSNRIDNLTSSTTSGTNLKLNISDTSVMLSNRIERDTISLSNRINTKVNTLNATVDSSLYVNGKVRIDSVLTLNDSLRVVGNVLIDSNLTIKGKLSIDGGFNFRDSLTVARGARIDSSLLLKGKLLLNDSLLAKGNVVIDNNLLVNQKTRLNDSLTVMGVTRLNDSLTVRGRTRINDSLLVRGSAMIDKDLIVNGKLSINGGFDFQDSLTVTRGARIDSSLLLKGKLLLGDSLIANGIAKINNNLLVTGNTNTGTLSSTSTDAGILSAGNTSITGTLSTTGVATIGDNLLVTNNTRTGTLSVTGATTLTGAATISSTLSVADATTLNNGLTVTGVAKLNDSLNVKGRVGLDSTLYVKKVATLGDSLSVRGNALIDSNLKVGQNLIVGGKLTVASGLDFKDSLTVSRGARIDSSLLLKGKLLLVDSLLAKGIVKIDSNLFVKGRNVYDSIMKYDTSKVNVVDTAAMLEKYARKFTKDVKLNLAPGRTLGKYNVGDSVYVKGKTLDEFLYEMTNVSIPYTYTAPTAGISSNKSSSYEIGTDMTSLGPVNLSISYNKYNGGDSVANSKIFYKKDGDGPWVSLGAGVSSDINAGTLSGTSRYLTSSISYKVNVSYNAGPVEDDNLGVPSPAGQIGASNVTGGPITISPFQNRYWGKSTTESITNYLQNAENNAGSKAYTLSNLVMNNEYIFFAYPSGLGVSTFVLNGFPTVFSTYVQTFNNAQGYPLTYRIYVSPEKYTGTITSLKVN